MLSLKESILSSTRTGKSVFKIIVNSWLELSNAIKKIVRKNSIHCSLNDIDTSKIETMSELFEYKKFDGDISKWDVRNVTYMACMFKYSSYTGKNGDISKWDVRKVTNMYAMFINSKYNGDISKWDVSNVMDMRHMFKNSQFNQDISSWKINPNCKTEGMFENCPIRDEYKPKQNGKTIE